MFHVHFTKSKDVIDQLIQVMKACDVALLWGLILLESGGVKSEMTFGDAYGEVPESKIIEAIEYFKVLRQ